MRCPACGVLLHDTDSFCRRCGARCSPTADRPRLGPKDRTDEPEQTLWSGSYSIKAMFREIALAVGATIAIFLFTSNSADPQVGAWQLPGVLLVLSMLAAYILFRKLDVHYRISNQRLFHEDGILYRRLNRIEILDIDDLRCEQGIVERLLGVGRILVSSSDDTDPIFVMQGVDRVRDVYEIIDRARRRERLRHGLHIEAI